MSFLTQFSERAGTHRRLSLVSVIGLVLVPFVIAGVLVWALWNPQERLDTLSAAIVNNDKPVTLNGQTLPLGRELAAGLVGTAKPGSKKAGENYSWSITDAADARSGLKSGKYTAVITIPKGFSAAATSTADPADARKATIRLQTSDSSKVLDQTISQTIAQTAAARVGNSLTTAYLDNIYVGYSTLSEKLGEASGAADQLSTTGADLVSGAQQTADAQQQLADAQQQLADGLSPLADGADELANGAGDVADGTQQLSDGAQPLADGAQQLSAGLQQLNAQAGQLSSLGGGLSTASQLLGDLDQLQASGLAADCTQGNQNACQQLATQVSALTGPFQPGQLAALASGLQQASGPVGQLPNAVSQLSTAADQLSDGAAGLSSGLQQTASGAAQLVGAASSLSNGADQSADAAQQLADGSSEAASGSAQLADGLQQYNDGTTQLATGLDAAVASIPSYSKPERTKLASVVATPVSASSGGVAGFGVLAAPIFGVLALWLGALASFIVLRPVSVLALGSPRSSFIVGLRGLVVPGLIGVVQGAAVAGALQPLLQLGVGPWFGLAGIGALAGVAFAAVNQALVALFGGAGRFVSMFVILLGLATGLVGTAPRFMSTITDFTPIAPAQRLVESVVQGNAPQTSSLVLLVLWLLGAIAVTTLAVARGRMVPASKLAPKPARVRKPRSRKRGAKPQLA